MQQGTRFVMEIQLQKAMLADGPITWYDAMTGGNVVGSGDNPSVAPTATTSYYAEAKAAVGYSDD